jgi:hypothetical protein
MRDPTSAPPCFRFTPTGDGDCSHLEEAIALPAGFTLVEVRPLIFHTAHPSHWFLFIFYTHRTKGPRRDSLQRIAGGGAKPFRPPQPRVAHTGGGTEQGQHSIGRDTIAAPTVDEAHARVEVTSDGEAFLTDCGSTNGTTINGRGVEPGVRLRLLEGDAVRVARASSFGRIFLSRSRGVSTPPSRKTFR